MSTPQTTVIRLKFQADASALAKGLKEVTQATAGASKAEQAYQRVLKERERGRSFGSPGGAPSPREEMERQREERDRPSGGWRGREATGSYGLLREAERLPTAQSLSTARRVVEGSPYRGQAAGTAVEAEARERVRQAMFDRDVHGRMKEMGWAANKGGGGPGGYSPVPDEKPKDEPGFLKALIASRGGAAGIATAAAFAGAHGLRNYESTYTDAFTTKNQRTNRFMEGIPVVGTGWRMGRDAWDEVDSGATNIRKTRESAAVGQIMARGFAERSEITARMRPDELEREERNRGYSGYSAARVPGGIDRTTGNGRVQYQEELRLLALRDKATKATIEEGAARAKSLGVAKEQERVQADIVDLTKRRDMTFGMAQKAERMSDQKGVEWYTGLSKQFDTRLTSAYNQNRTLEQEGAAARTSHAQAITTARQADLDVKRGRLSIGQAAEEEGSSHAKSLAYMGLAGRFHAEQSLKLVRMLGVENTPPEYLAAARSIAPNEVDQKAEETGVGLAQAYRGVTDDIRNERAANLPAQRKQNDQDFESVTAGGEYIDKAGVSMVTDALRGLLERTVGANMAAIAQEIQSMQLAMFARHAEQSR